MKMPFFARTGRMMWYCLPSVMRMSSMVSFRPRLFIVFSFARTTSVLPAAASSRSSPAPAEPSIMPLLASTRAAHIAPSVFRMFLSDSFTVAIEYSWIDANSFSKRRRQRLAAVPRRPQQGAECFASPRDERKGQARRGRRDAEDDDRAELGFDDETVATPEPGFAAHGFGQ